ncbi:MAG TPA: GlcNAc-transferase family protein [Pyrinomonadaceae bacterium]
MALISDQIFVQIPAYRDRELLPTITNLFEQARQPQRLRVVVAWQYGAEELRLEKHLRRWPNLELLKFPAAQSEGCNWARRIMQERWAGERYTLFLDSHHRFISGWDDEAIDMLEALRRSGVNKPILTGYLPPYDPQHDPAQRSNYIFYIRPAERHRGMLFYLIGDPVPAWSELNEPLRAKFASLHFLFADGVINEELAMDPSIYFFVDEIAISLRAYTLGYDLFHPHRILGWHLYNRSTRVTHWADNSSARIKSEVTYKRIRALFSGRWQGKYGLGSVRSAADYEAAIGEPLILKQPTT